jgi:hypothetical protein
MLLLGQTTYYYYFFSLVLYLLIIIIIIIIIIIKCNERRTFVFLEGLDSVKTPWVGAPPQAGVAIERPVLAATVREEAVAA